MGEGHGVLSRKLLDKGEGGGLYAYPPKVDNLPKKKFEFFFGVTAFLLNWQIVSDY